MYPGKVKRYDNLDFLGKQKVDFSIRELRLAFEYDGEQHFESIEHFGGHEGLLKRQERDARKNALCQENKYDLVRISYTEDLSTESVEKKIKEIMEKRSK
jgi:very-short-patch-repair endonuclease